MKKLLLSLFFFFACVVSFAQPVSYNDKIVIFSSVWGFLKYFHPAVAMGKFDMDKEFIDELPLLENVNNQEELSALLQAWIKKFGDVNSDTLSEAVCNIDDLSLSERVKNMPEVLSLLNKIYNHRNTGNGFYVMQNQTSGNALFCNEAAYDDNPLPSKPYCLLALARYWNMVEYFYPYKNLTDIPWYQTLSDLTTDFVSVKNYWDYYYGLCKLAARLNDRHAIIYQPEKNKQEFYSIAFGLRILDSVCFVSYYKNEAIANKDHIFKGDKIISINDSTIDQLIAQYEPYISVSNKAMLYEDAPDMLTFCASDKPVKMCWVHNKDTFTKYINRYNISELNYEPKADAYPVSTILQEDIGYINLGKLMPVDVKNILSGLLNTKGIILDLRNYPNETWESICDFFSIEKIPFAKFTQPDFSCYGSFVPSGISYCGKRRTGKIYQGKIIVLVNSKTISHAEYTAMALKTLPNTIMVGTPTAGADGNISQIVLPGGFHTQISGLGVCYPDGTPTQRIGIRPDKIVNPTMQGVLNDKDEILDYAIKMIKEEGNNGIR